MKDVRERFRKSYRHDPDEQALLGYVAAQVIKAATERVGNFNTFAFVYTMKTLVLKAADVPEVLVDLRYDANGDVERGGFIVEVRDHRHAIVAELPLS
jgi:branched-chain amino acid transport system substrate-binding protein